MLPMWAVFVLLHFSFAYVSAYLDKLGLYLFIATGIFIGILTFSPSTFPVMSGIFMELPWYWKLIFGFGSYIFPYFAWGALIGCLAGWGRKG